MIAAAESGAHVRRQTASVLLVFPFRRAFVRTRRRTPFPTLFHNVSVRRRFSRRAKNVSLNAMVGILYFRLFSSPKFFRF